ncbi:MAG: MarR family transcriptional regulator [Eggerthellaceae bacterium]|nr:MarR family transcriptional regulator [Eggerthellaceae bacterium]
MADSITTFKQLKKASKLACLTMHKNGPKSFRRGVGSLLRALDAEKAVTRDELIEHFGFSRKHLKNIVKKAEKSGLVAIVEADEGYAVTLTAEGADVLAKREEANVAAADKLFAALSDEEQEQLGALLDKIVVAAKDEDVTIFGKDYKDKKIKRCGNHKPCCK